MASAFNLTHNKYVSTPDWFKDVDISQSVEQPTTTTVLYTGNSVSGGSSGMSNITLYNKYAMKLSKLDSDALSVKNTAFVLKTTSTGNIGDTVNVIGWDSTDYVSVAGEIIKVTSTVDPDNELYGILFYDNRRIPISGEILTTSPEEVPVPSNSSFFRISVPTNQLDFLIEHYVVTEYTKEQLKMSGNNPENYLELNEEIPEGLSVITFNDNLKLLVQQPLSASRDVNNVIKLSAESSDVDDMFVWDKKLAALGYDKETGKAFVYVDGEQLFIVDENGETVPEMTDNPELWMYDENLTDKWIIKTTKQRFSLLEGLMEYDAEKDSFLFHKNIITSGGIVMYADLDDVNVPGLYDGLPIDNDTIFWNYDEEGNKLSLSAKTIKSIETTGEGNAITNVIVSKDNREITFVKEETFVTVDDIMDHIKTDDDTITVNQNGELEVLKGGVEIVSSLPSYYEPDILYILV